MRNFAILPLSLIVLFLAQIGNAGSETSFYACKSVVEFSAMSQVDQGMDILSARSYPYPDQSKFDLAKGQVRVRIVVDEDQAGLHTFGATVEYTVEFSGSDTFYRCLVTDLESD